MTGSSLKLSTCNFVKDNRGHGPWQLSWPYFCLYSVYMGLAFGALVALTVISSLIFPEVGGTMLLPHETTLWVQANNSDAFFSKSVMIFDRQVTLQYTLNDVDGDVFIGHKIGKTVRKTFDEYDFQDDLVWMPTVSTNRNITVTWNVSSCAGPLKMRVARSDDPYFKEVLEMPLAGYKTYHARSLDERIITCPLIDPYTIIFGAEPWTRFETPAFNIHFVGNCKEA